MKIVTKFDVGKVCSPANSGERRTRYENGKNDKM